MKYVEPELVVSVSALKVIRSGAKLPPILLEAYTSPFMSNGAYQADE